VVVGQQFARVMMGAEAPTFELLFATGGKMAFEHMADFEDVGFSHDTKMPEALFYELSGRAAAVGEERDQDES
jgi:hypothetical protein